MSQDNFFDSKSGNPENCYLKIGFINTKSSELKLRILFIKVVFKSMNTNFNNYLLE